MRRKLLVGIAVLATLMLGACSSQQDTTTQNTQETTTEATSEKSSTTEKAVSNNKKDSKKILIAYFTWGDNTRVENPDEVDIDASTSASVLAPGNSAKMAKWIQEEVGGDLFSIKVEQLYSSDYDETLDRAADEKAENARPKLENHVKNFDEYDTIFIGYPNWWYTLPMPIHSFIESYNFKGKTVIPFCTHGTGGFADTTNDLTKALPKDTKILDPIGVYRDDVDSSEQEVKNWAKALKF